MNSGPDINTQPFGASHIGQALRARRDILELSLADISEVTHINVNFLTAIETLDMETLPSIAHGLGFVRSYAKALGMNDNDAVADFKRDIAAPDNLVLRGGPGIVPKRKITLPRGLIPALSVLGFAVMLTTWYGLNTETNAAPSATDFTAIDLNSPDGTALQAELQPSLITLRATAPSWVQVSDKSGSRIVSRVFVTGETWQAAREAGYVVSVRDAGAVEIFIGTQKLPPLGADGEAVYNAVLGEQIQN
jgi:hypothetical protein